MAGEWDVVEETPVGRPAMRMTGIRRPAPVAQPVAPADPWEVVQEVPVSAPGTGARRQVGFAEAAERAARGMFASANEKAGQLVTTLPAKGLQALVNVVTGEPGTGIVDWQRGKFIEPWQQIARESAVQPNEELTLPGIAGNVVGSVGGMAPELLLGGPVRAGGEAGLSILQNALDKVMRQMLPSMNSAATAGFNRSSQLQAQGVPKEVADRAALESYPTNVLGFAFPLNAAGNVARRAIEGGASNLALEIPAVAQENRVLREAGHEKHVQDLLDPANAGTSASLGAVLGALFGQRAPRTLTRSDAGYVPGTPNYVADPARVPDWAMQRYADILRANGLTDPADPRTVRAVERLQQSETRRAEMRPGQGDPNVDQAREDVFAGDVHPNAAPWAGRVAETPPSSVRVDAEGNAIPLDETGAPVRPGDVAGFENLDAARQQQIREAYIRAGLDPDAQLNAMRRQDVAPDESPDTRSLKAELDDDQAALISHYMGVPPDELRTLGPNSQRRLLARAMEAQERDTGRTEQGAFQTTFEGGDERASPASRPNVPGDRMEARSEFEDTDARLAQDQLAAELNELRERAARGDKQAAKELRGREVAAKKAAKEKSKLIGRLDDMRKQRDALKRSREYADLRRTRETGGTLTKKQEKTLEGFEKQDERLGSAIFDLEGRIYEISEQADLASVAASGPGDRPFRGFSAEEAEHAGMFEQRARERATAEEKAMLDRLEEEWRARQKIFEERRARARAEQEARERAGRGRDQRESTSTGPKPTGEGTGEAAPPRDGVYGTNEDGFVTSTNGEPIQFGHQRDAGWWILKVGNKASGGQVFEIANHPSGNGFTVRETHRNGPTGGKADEGRNAGSGKGESGGGARAEESRAGGPLEARGELPRSETNQTRRDAESDQASQEILALARSVAENRSDNTRRTVTYGRASERVIDLLKAHGIDATRYVHVVDNFAIGHTLKNHGNEKIESARGQVAITPEDFAKIPEVVSFPDKVEWDGKTRVGRDAIRYTKRFNGHLIVVEEVRTGRNRLALTSMRKTRATRNATSASNPKSPAPTSETLRAQSDESIAGKPGEEQGQPPNPTPNQPKGISDKQRAYRERLRKRGVARRIIDAGDTLMEAIIKLGGIHESLRGDLIGDSKGNRNIPFVGYLFNKTGTHDLSDLANQLGEGRWYFTPQELADVDGGAALLAERLRTEYDGGEPHRSYDDQDKTDAEYEQALRDREWELYERARADAEARGIPWDENQSVESAVDAYYARQQEDIAALEKELADAYKEAEALMGDRVDDIFEEGGRDPDESWYRANIKALEDAIEEENAYRENIRTRETDAGREEESDFDGSRDDSDDRDSQEAGGAPGEAAGRTEGGESSEAGSRDEFTLKSQSEAELKKRAEEEEAARAREEAEKRRTEAEERKAREQKEIADRQEESARNFKLGESAEDSLSGQGDLLSDTPPNTKPDSGTLYANPFHKALGWFLGDSRAWADSLNELRRSIADLKKSAGVTVRSNPVVAFARAFFESSSADMRAAIRLNPSKTAEWVIDQFHDRAGGGKATGETFGHALAAKVSRAMVDLHRALGDLVHDEAGMEQVARMLRSGTARAGTRLGNAAIALRKMLDDELKYLREAGVDVGEVRQGYFPREYVVDKIIRNGQGFIDAATRAYQETGLNRPDAAAAAKELHDTLVYGEYGNIFKSQGGGGHAPFLKGRVFGKQVDNPSHPLYAFLNHDVAEVLSQYFQRSAKRAEIARRFGDNFSHWRDYKDAQGRKQEGLLTKIEKEGGQGALPKLQEYIALAAGIRSYGLGAGSIRAASIMRTWGALSFLEKATLSSLTEFIVPAMRSGNVLDAGRSLSRTLNDLFVKTKSAQERRAFAEDLGLIAGHIDSALSAARFAGGEPVGKLESRVLDRFFKRTGLTQWTDATRVAATDIGRVFVRRLAIDTAGKLNARHLADLGIPADKMDAFKAFVKSRNGGMPTAADLKGEMGDLYRVAIRKFVSQSIMNPSAVTKPSWMSHPIGAVVGQLQSFNYAFYENVIKRNVRLARESATGSGYTAIERARMVAPMMISPLLIAAAYAIGEGRDELLGDPNRRREETEREKWIKAASRGMPIAPLDPIINFITSAKYQRGAAQSFAGPVAGVAAIGIDAARDYFFNNAEKTNTQERAALRATWDIFIEPAVNLALFAAPVSPFSAAVTQAAGSGNVREELFITPLAGPKHQKGSRAHGRIERTSPR